MPGVGLDDSFVCHCGCHYDCDYGDAPVRGRYLWRDRTLLADSRVVRPVG